MSRSIRHGAGACACAGVTVRASVFEDEAPARRSTTTKEFSPPTADPPDPLARAIHLVRDNERLFAALRETTLQLRRARAYLSSPASNPVLARVHLDRIRSRRAGLLAHLRANRIEALALLGGSGPVVAGVCATEANR